MVETPAEIQQEPWYRAEPPEQGHEEVGAEHACNAVLASMAAQQDVERAETPTSRTLNEGDVDSATDLKNLAVVGKAAGRVAWVNSAPREPSECPEDPEQVAPECCPESRIFARRPRQRRRQQQPPEELCEIEEVSPRQSATSAVTGEGATTACMQVSDLQSPMSNSMVAPIPTQSIFQAPVDSPAESPAQAAAVHALRRVVAARAEVAWEDQAPRPPQDRRPPRRRRVEQSPGSPSRVRLRQRVRESPSPGSPGGARLRQRVRKSPEGLHAECPEQAIPATGQDGTGSEALNKVDMAPTVSKSKRPGTSHTIDMLVLPNGQGIPRSRAEDVYSAWGSREDQQDDSLRTASAASPPRTGHATMHACPPTCAKAAREPAGQATVEGQCSWAWQRKPGGPSPSGMREDDRLRNASRASPSRDARTPAGRRDGPLNRRRPQGGALQFAGQLITETDL